MKHNLAKEIRASSHRVLHFMIGLLLLAIAGLSVRGAELQTLRGSVPLLLQSLTPISRLPATNQLHLAIGLPLRNPAALSNLLRQIYEPVGLHHHYLTPSQFTEQFGPTVQDYQAVIAFAKSNHLQVTTMHPNRLLLDVSGTASEVERAFHVTLYTYQHPTEERTFYAPDQEPSLDLNVPILQISGLDNFGLPRPHLHVKRIINGRYASPNTGSGPNGTYMGLDFRAAYVPATTLDGSGQVVGLLQFDGYTASDIAYYEKKAGLQAVPLQNVLLDGFSGSPTGDGGEVEVSLDIENTISMATNLSKVIVYEAGPFGSWHDILNRMANDNLAKQLSCSWYIPGGGADAVADEIFQQMAAQGQSFFNASGDDDAYTGLISFAGDSPYITQVGGTTLTTAGPQGAWVSETVWNWGDGNGSGGGISTQYPIPSWQTNISMTANQGSTTMRNTPDVAFIADEVYVRADGVDYDVGGTSCAAPLWAGFAALVNQQAAGSGQPAIGFINPAAEAIGSGANYTAAFHDIATGNNTNSSSPKKFYAVAGYDLCTGWGTPAGQNLINALANPEPLLITPTTGFSASGGVGGPFFPVTSQKYSLTNGGTNVLTWTLSNTSVWLNASASGGRLLPGGPAATVTVSLNSAASNLLVGTYTATLWWTNQNDKLGQSRQFALSVISPPSITQQPTDQAVLEGAAAAFSVQAAGGLPPAYQWQFNGTNLTDNGNCSGSTTTSLTINDVSAANEGNYSLVATNVAGSVTSSNAALTITPSPPVIITQPKNQIAVAGTTAQFAVAAIGNRPFSYQWIFGSNHIDGATNATLTLADVQFTNAGNYAVEITNKFGSTLSTNAVLAVVDVPLITAFSPQVAAVSNQVTIVGANFDPSPANDIVYFGAVTAAVLAASPTNLVVSVPAGATFAPITVTVNGLTAFAPGLFLPTFLSGGNLSSSSLAAPVVFAVGAGPRRVLAGDLDGDGKPDLAVLNDIEGTVYVYRNVSTNGTLAASSFAPPVVLTIAGGANSLVDLALADLTGDGRLDILVSDYSYNQVAIFQNFSSPGSLTTSSFGAEVDLPVGGAPSALAVADLDGDGRPDIITASQQGNTVSILKNLGGSTLNAGSFAAPVSFATGPAPWGVCIADVDGDDRPDLVTVNQNDPNHKVSILRNLGLVGSITTNSFAPAVDLAGADKGETLTMGDLDGDGKSEVVVGSYTGGTIAVYRNTSVAGSITTNSFAAPVVYAVGARVHTLALGDLDGDGKPDVAVVTELPSELVLFKNLSAPGSFTASSLGPQLNFAAGNDALGVAVADLDGDGRPDLAFVNYYDGTVEIYQNLVPFGTAPVITLQPTSQTVAVGGTATFGVSVTGATPLSYQWSFDQTNLLAGATNALLTLANVQLTNTGSYAVLVGNWLGSVTSSNAVLTVLLPPVITAQPTNQTVTAGGTTSFSITASGTPPLSYQWFFNQTNLVPGATNAVLMLASVQFGSSGSYSAIVSNLAGSVSSSNALLTVLAPPAIVVQPANQSAAVGGTASFSVSAIGSIPLSYQWFFNQSNLLTGATSAMLTLTNVQASQSGSYYSVQVSNLYGATNSASAALTVLPCEPPPAGMSGWWQGEGNASDAISGSSGVIEPGTTFTAGMVGQCFSFDGINGCIMNTNTPPLTNIQNSFTMEFWAYPQAGFDLLPVGQGLGTSGQSYAVFPNYGGTTGPGGAGVCVGTNGISVMEHSENYLPSVLSYAHSLQGWVHVAVVYSSKQPALYVNGVLVGTGSVSPLTFVYPSKDFGGSYASAEYKSYGPYTGLLDEVSIYNRSLTASEIEAIYAAGSGGKCIAPVPPVIATQPTNQSVNTGGTVTFAVVANGTQPLSYQWFFDQTNQLAGATNALLTLVNVQLTNAGNYAVLVSNWLGSVTSSNAILIVNPPPTNTPVITAFSPQVAAVSNQVAIVGANFDPSLANDIVYFGAVQAAVQTASPTNLLVSVPAGATFAPITVTVNGLTAFAPSPFLPTFFSGGSLGSNSLAAPALLGAGLGPSVVLAGDMDGDGKPDLVVLDDNDGTVYVYRNLSTNGSLAAASFAPPVVLTIAGGAGVWGLALADLTGDGRLDILVGDLGLNHVAIFQNLAFPGILTTNSFGTEVDIPVSGAPSALTVADLDGDGRPDIVTANHSSNTISILKNLGAGTISAGSFAAPVSFATGSSPWGVCIADMDGDGRPDVVTVNQGSSAQKVSILRNLGLVGGITTNSFAPAVNLAGADTGETMTVEDVDGDGKPDVVVGSHTGQTIAVYRNTSNPGSITANSFAAPVVFAIGADVHAVALGDLDGDGRPDVAVVTELSSKLVLFKNLSTPGSFTTNSLGPRISYATGNNANGVAIVDLDGDGRSDLAFGNKNDGTVEVYRNVIPFGSVPLITIQPTNQAVAAGGTVTFGVSASGTMPLNYQWIFDQTNLLAGATNALFVLANVQLSNAGNYAVLVSNGAGSTNSANAVLTVQAAPSITSQPANQTVAAGGSASFSVTASGTAPLSCQWRFNDTNLAGATNFALTLANVQFTNVGNYSVRVTNFLGSATSSNALLTVLAPPAITLPPASSTNVAGTTASFFAAANGALPLSYQWQKNGVSLNNGGNVSGAATTSLTLASVQDADAASYALVVTNVVGSVTSAPAILVVLDPPAITLQPTNQFVQVGSNAVLLSAASGTAPLGCQWSCNGTNLCDSPRITGSQCSVLIISNALIRDTGNYQVVFTNSLGSATSSVALLTVGRPPEINTQPATHSAPLGCTVSFNVVASGSRPLSDQWWKDGTLLNAQTNATLAVSNFQSADLGSYSVVVTNWFGSVTSSPAILSVGYHPPVAGADTVQRFAAGGIRISVRDLLAHDVDTNGDNLTIIGVGPNSTAGGSVSLANNWVYYASPVGWTNSDSFTYTVSDGLCETAQGTVLVEVTADNPQPAHFAIGSQTSGAVQLSFTGIPGNQYQLEYTDSLINPNWQLLATQAADGFGVCQFTDSSPTTTGSRYYRAIPVLVLLQPGSR